MRTKANGKAVKVSLAVALGMGVGLTLTVPAFAAGYGNSVNGCYGVYFSTAWGQQCDAGKPSERGIYHSHADCSLSPDHDMSILRDVGSSDYIKASDDCAHSVRTVTTGFQGS